MGVQLCFQGDSQCLLLEREELTGTFIFPVMPSESRVYNHWGGWSRKLQTSRQQGGAVPCRQTLGTCPRPKVTFPLTHSQWEGRWHRGGAVLPKPEALGLSRLLRLPVATFSAEQELHIREMPQGFSLGLSLLSAHSATVRAVDRDSQTELSVCSF